ncbi:MAG: class I SAM-dependent methyltransferase [Lactobacillales bacterium]|jgi:hypothetical protein|nr:class I SAM-dependent methyltransferase [Lactobacillales bacterium]
MIIFLSFFYVLIVLAVLFCGILALYILFSSRFMAYPPIIVSTGKTKAAIIRRVSKRIAKCEQDEAYTAPLTIIEAGCGIGTLIKPLAGQFPAHQFVGLEWSWPAYLIAKFRTCGLKNVRIIRQNMFDYSFHKSNIVICFLIDHLMPKFAQKCEKELVKKSYVFSNRFKMTNWDVMETMDFGDKYAYLHMYKYRPWGKRRTPVQKQFEKIKDPPIFFIP